MASPSAPAANNDPSANGETATSASPASAAANESADSLLGGVSSDAGDNLARGAGVSGGGLRGVEGSAGEEKGGSGAGEIYLARVNWLQDGSLCAQVQNRNQTELRLLRLDPNSGAHTVLVVERSKVWINLHHLLRSLPSPTPQVCVCSCVQVCGYMRSRRMRKGGGRWSWTAYPLAFLPSFFFFVGHARRCSRRFCFPSK